MALKKQIERAQNNYRALFANGYHRISELQFDRDNGRVRVRVSAFADEDARLFGENIQDQLNHRMYDSWFDLALPVDDMEGEPDNLVAWVYVQLKLDDRFSGAEDC
jgi:hypothetical protein